MATSWNRLGCGAASASAVSAPDPAAVLGRRPPVPQVQHDHPEHGQGGERVVQPDGGRFGRMGGGQVQRAGDGRLTRVAEQIRGRRGAGNFHQQRQRHRQGRSTAEHPALASPLRDPGREQPDQPDPGDDAGVARDLRCHQHQPGREAGHGRQPVPQDVPEADVQHEHRTAPEQPGRDAVARPADHADQPGSVERPRRPDHHPANAGRVAQGQLDRDGSDHRAAADGGQHDADSPHMPSVTG